VNDIHDAARMQLGELVVAGDGCVALLGALGGGLIAIHEAHVAIDVGCFGKRRKRNDEREHRR
jgi:hypothetical protein